MHSALLHNRQYESRRLCAVVIERLFRGDAANAGANGFPGPKVAAPARVRAARDLQPNAVARLETVSGRPQLDFDTKTTHVVSPGRARLNAHEPVAYAERPTVGRDITQASDKIRIVRTRTNRQSQPCRSNDVEVGFECSGREREHIFSRFYLALVLKAGPLWIQSRSADRRGRILWIVKIVIGRSILRWFLLGQAAAGVEQVAHAA